MNCQGIPRRLLLLLDPHPKSIHTPRTMIIITPKQLRKAADIQEKIQSLQEELGQLLGGFEAPAIETPRRPKKRKMSAAGRAAIAAAARARWARIKGTAPSAKPAKKAKRKLTPAMKAALERAWAARRAKTKP